MKSKAEMIDALQVHMLEPDCKGCAYISEFNEKEYPCYMSLINDVVDTLSKSDFEVMKEILSRSRLYAKVRVDHNNQYDWSIISLDGYDGVDIEFDEEGNIL